jgi:Tryptophan halogenase
MSTNPTPPENILIVGGGSAGWMTASVFLQSMGKNGSKISLIESSNIPTIGVGEGTTPLFKRFLNFLNIPEAEFMSACKATIKLGINFPGWTNSDEFETYFHPFAAPGHNQHDQQFFENCNQRRKGESVNTNPADFFFNSELAAQYKAPVGPPPCDSSTIDYAYHFDTSLLADYLKQRCLEQGINYIVDDVKDVIQNENGGIDRIVTADSGEMSADLFVDCTGFRRLLISKTEDKEIISYKPRLFNDRAVVIRTPVSADVNFPPFTESRAMKCGWAWRIPIGSKISWGYVHSADYTTQEDAEQELRELIGEEAKGIEPLNIKLQTGRVSKHWNKNCLAIGLSQGFIEPLEATALALTQFSINRFVTHFSRGGYQTDYRDHFNEIVNEAFDCTVDYIQLHYKLNSRKDTQYWRDCSDNENITDTQRAVIAGWDSQSADFISVLKEQVHRSSYAPYSWYCILSGMGRYAKANETQVDNRIANPYKEEVSQYYGHQEYLNSIDKG